LKNKTDDLARKNNEFIEFRKKYLENNEKTKQEIIGLNEEIKKINQKEEGMKKIEGMSNILSSLDPHKICEIG
jgi:ribosomal protein S2